MNKKILLSFLFFAHVFLSRAQTVHPGFDKEELKMLMHVSAQFGDTAYRASLPPPAGYQLTYDSPVMGLDNKWQLWMTDKGVPVLSIRGTTKNPIGWTANFYAAMVPAKGSLQLSKTKRFNYQLASHPRATVHTGWLICTAFLSEDMLPKIDSLQKAGHNEMYIIGHSQGAAIAYLLTAHLHHLQKSGRLSSSIRFKTYCGAAPKPGNLYFAYEYEAATQGGWSYAIVNSADWVPETPISVQTLNDFNQINPFINAKGIIRQQSFFKRLALNYAFGKLKNPNQQAASNYRKYLGKYVAKTIKKHLPGFVEPTYASSIDYVRTGAMITLLADDDYYKKYPQDEKTVFVNHFHQPYLYLLDKLTMDNATTTASINDLSGAWVLASINEADILSLYPDRKPELRFEQGRVSGSTGCNRFSGPITIEADRIKFAETMAMTKMACPGNGEPVFLEALKKITTYRIENGLLVLLSNDKVVMQLRKL